MNERPAIAAPGVRQPVTYATMWKPMHLLARPFDMNPAVPFAIVLFLSGPFLLLLVLAVVGGGLGCLGLAIYRLAQKRSGPHG